MHYFIGLVELECYQFEPERSGIIVVPRIVQEIQPVERAYVHIDFADGLEQQISVKPLVSAKPSPVSSGRTNQTEDDFLKNVESSVGKEIREKVHNFYKELSSDLGLELDFKGASLMLKIPQPEGDGLGVSVLGIWNRGYVYNTQHILMQLKRWGFKKELLDKIASDYWAKLHTIDHRFNTAGINHMASGKFIPFSELTDKLAGVRECIEDVVARIRNEFNEEGIAD